MSSAFKTSLSPTLLALVCAPLSTTFAAETTANTAEKMQHHSEQTQNSPLVNKVRQATRQFQDINAALSAGWVPGTPCVSGPNSGAMGVHFILPERVGDGELDADEPEALIYEPLPGGKFRLVGVEFIVLAEDWAAKNPDGGAPALEGHLTNLVPAPNRYGLPTFHELHVWAWEDNPNGNFADWNTNVSCDHQPLD